ncbi:hypothetical protein THASP1DRAFT_23600, partial [Thamnocephalis sphaerospora]
IPGSAHDLLHSFFRIYKAAAKTAQMGTAVLEQVTTRIQLLRELLAADALQTLDFHTLVSVGQTGNIDTLRPVYMELASDNTHESCIRIRTDHSYMSTCSILKLRAISGLEDCATEVTELRDVAKLESCTYRWYLEATWSKAIGNLGVDWDNAMEACQLLFDYLTGGDMADFVSEYAQREKVNVGSSCPVSLQSASVPLDKRQQLVEMAQEVAFMQGVDEESSSALVDAVLLGASPLVVHSIIGLIGEDRVCAGANDNVSSAIEQVYQAAFERIIASDVDVAGRLAALIDPLATCGDDSHPWVRRVYTLLCIDTRGLLDDAARLTAQDRFRILDLLDQHASATLAENADVDESDLEMRKIKSIVKGTWHMEIASSDIDTPENKHAWLVQRVDEATDAVQCQAVMRILKQWTGTSAKSAKPDNVSDIWCHILLWMVSQKQYRWCIATRLLLNTESSELEELDKKMLDVLSMPEHGSLHYLQYCLLASDSQLAAKAVVDIRTDLNDPEKAAQFYADGDMHMLLCARGIFTELASTPLLPHILDTLFCCPCGKASTAKVEHPWRDLLISQVAMNLELCGYDELSAHVAARYLGIGGVRVDSIAVRASMMRTMEAAAAGIERRAQLHTKPLPQVYHLDDVQVDGHMLHWIITQTLLC